MDKNNPDEMSNEDLENDIVEKRKENPTGNQESLNKSTAAEGELKTPLEDPASVTNIRSGYNPDEEQDVDDLVHRQAEEQQDSQDGSLPDPEEVGNWENNEDDVNKISS
jgi:hypothetical protein